MRAAPVIISTAVLALVAVGVGVAVAQPSGDAVDVGAVSVGDVTVDDRPTATDDTDAEGTPTDGSTATSSPSTTSPGAPQQVAGLDTVQGVLTRDDDSDHQDDDSDDGDDSDYDRDDDRDDFEVAGVDLELGPESWLLGAGPIADFDGDGTVRPVLEELENLIGQEVTVLGRLDDDGDDLQVYEIQGLTFRPSSGPAPWQDAGGDALSRDEIVQVALDAVGAGSRLDSVDTEDDGGAAWEVEVYDGNGVEQRVLLDAVGTVLDIRRED